MTELKNQSANGFAIGACVRLRGRDWIVESLPQNSVLTLRPLGGSSGESIGVFLPLEQDDIVSAEFSWPNIEHPGDAASARLLRDAVRLGFRSSAGPFRSFAKLGFDPRPYQLTPLIMALRMETIRLLIADDVGIGKTIEAGLIARELLDRGEIESFAVLCPPQLAEQWQNELSEKFHIEAELVLSGAVAKLERQCAPNESLFERFPFTIVSTDFMKSDRRRDEFLRVCPNFVIVDEAHTCANSGEGGSAQQQRFQLLSALAQKPNRHITLVTATPHSGKENAFRSLLSLLNPKFTELPEDLTGAAHESDRRELAKYFVQRRRADLAKFLQSNTPFPEREETEAGYTLSAPYQQFFHSVMEYLKHSFAESQSLRPTARRANWWSALALLRSIGSSPAAAAATLRARALLDSSASADEIDNAARETVLDAAETDRSAADTAPASFAFAETPHISSQLDSLATAADALKPEDDAKLKLLFSLLAALKKDHYNPIVFCRFIPTAKYLAEHIQAKFPKIAVAFVTGLLPPEERERAIAQLAEKQDRVLVSTDCLSEGINLQDSFDAVIHYDLAWNPTRHEQREGRADRFGQKRDVVKMAVMYGKDNYIDGKILDVLIRKHNTIRKSLGISVPAPIDSEQVIRVIMQSYLNYSDVQQGALFEDASARQWNPDTFDDLWKSAEERERRSRTMFAQETIKPEELRKDLNEALSATGSPEDAKRFTADALRAFKAFVAEPAPMLLRVTELLSLPRAIREAIELPNASTALRLRFGSPAQENLPNEIPEIMVNRAHPIVAGLAATLADYALEGQSEAISRCGVMRAATIRVRTTLLLTRMRFTLRNRGRGGAFSSPLLIEDAVSLAFEGSPEAPVWLNDTQRLNELFAAAPSGNVIPEQAKQFLQKVAANQQLLQSMLENAAKQRAEEIRDAHERVRAAVYARTGSCEVTHMTPVDLLGVYIFLPNPQ